jgi:Protein of unknown function (DUF4232)
MRIPALSIAPVFAVLLLAGCTGSPAPTASNTPSISAPSETPSAAPSPSASAAEQVDPSAPPGQCKDTALKVTLSAPDGTAGSLNYVLTFTNTGTTDCVLEGYPTVYVVGNGNNTEFGVVAGQDANLPATTVTIEAAHSAVAALTAIDIDPGGGPLGTNCTVGHGDGYVVRPPHSYHQYSIVATGVPACTNGVAWMTVGTVQAG